MMQISRLDLSPGTDALPPPALDLDLSGQMPLPSWMSFSRAGAAMRRRTDGSLEMVASGQPRFSADISAGMRPALLIEEQRTNLLLQSSAIHLPPWQAVTDATTSVTVQAGAAMAPDGTMTAARLVFSGKAANAPLAWRQTVTGLVNPTILAPSVWLRADTPTTVWARPGNGAAGLVSLAVTTTWQRFELPPGSNGATSFDFDLGAPLQSAAPATSILAWGAQLEAGAQATSTILSGTTRGTRPAETLTAPLGSWFNPVRGTLAMDFTGPAADGIRRFLLNISDAGTTRFNVRSGDLGSGPFPVFVTGDGTTVSWVNAPAGAPSTGRRRVAVSWSRGAIRIAVNGQVSSAAAGGYTPNPLLTTLSIAGQGTATGHLNGHIARIRAWTRDLDPASLRQLTRAA